MTRGDARRRDATRSEATRRDATRRAAPHHTAPHRAAPHGRCDAYRSLSLAVSLLSFLPSTLFSHFYSPSFSPSPPLSLSVRCSAFLLPSPLYALFDRRPVSLASAIHMSRLSLSIFRSEPFPLGLHRGIYVRVHACMRIARTTALFVAGPAENTDLSPSASSPSTPTPLFWGFYTLSRATTKPRASTMFALLSLLLFPVSRMHKDPDRKE